MRPFGRLAAIAGLSLLLCACATRGQLVVDCPQFPAFVRDLPYSPLEAQIRNSQPGEAIGPAAALLPPPRAESEALDRAIDAAIARQAVRALESHTNKGQAAGPDFSVPSVLLLSGGGQWGAFGAGLLTALTEQNSPDRPNPVIITGVSTGALQMLFVGAGLEHEAVRQAFLNAYSPKDEKEIVSRQPQIMAVMTGAISGLSPLRKRIEQALCPDALAERGGPCPMLDRLRDTPVILRAGFVEAASGKFQYAQINDIARAELSPDTKRRCIAGAALASVAMPVFFQQVSVAGRTYYDGGVRQSVFAAQAQATVAAAMQRRAGTLQHHAPDTPLIVLRNGPTDTDADPNADETRNAIKAALRAEAIIVNQVEVNSVAALRLDKPTGLIGFASADGWRSQPGLPKDGEGKTCGDHKASVAGAQFIPAFMRCVKAYGDRRAQQAPVWTPLIATGPDQPAQPAGD